MFGGRELEVSSAAAAPGGDRVGGTSRPLSTTPGRERRASGATCRWAPGALTTPPVAKSPGRRWVGGEHEGGRGAAQLGALLGALRAAQSPGRSGGRGAGQVAPASGSRSPGAVLISDADARGPVQPPTPACSQHGQRGEYGFAADRFQGAQRAFEAADARAR